MTLSLVTVNLLSDVLFIFTGDCRVKKRCNHILVLQLVFLVLVGMLWLSAFEDSPQQQGSHVNQVCMHSAEVFRLVV